MIIRLIFLVAYSFSGWDETEKLLTRKPSIREKRSVFMNYEVILGIAKMTGVAK